MCCNNKNNNTCSTRIHFCRTDSREKLLQKQSAIGAIKDDPQSIRDIYNYSFAYAKDKNQKCMDVDVSWTVFTNVINRS